MLKELMATIGIGSAKVKLKTESPEVEIGGTYKGYIEIKGGSVEQVVKKVYVNLVLTSAYGSGSNIRHVNRTISTVTVMNKMILKPDQDLFIPIEFKIPLNIPVTKGRTRYYIMAGLEINQAIDPKASMPVKILPNSYMQMVFEAFSMLGFKEKAGFGDFAGMYQEFEFVPTKFMSEELDVIEIFPSTGEEEILISLHIIKSSWGCFGSVDIDPDERYKRFRLPYDEMTSSSQLAEKLQEIIKLEYNACC